MVEESPFDKYAVINVLEWLNYTSFEIISDWAWPLLPSILRRQHTTYG